MKYFYYVYIDKYNTSMLKSKFSLMWIVRFDVLVLVMLKGRVCRIIIEVETFSILHTQLQSHSLNIISKSLKYKLLLFYFSKRGIEIEINRIVASCKSMLHHNHK